MAAFRLRQRQIDDILNSPATGTQLAPRPCEESDRRYPAAPAPSAEPWALALSGGGFRATFAALGATRMLASVGRLSELRYTSSVSGGSVANGLVAAAWSQLRASDFTVAAFDELVCEPAIDRVSSASLKIAILKNLWRTVGRATRTDLLANKLDEWFFHGLTLADLDPQVRWIINAANLSSGVRFRFERDVLGDYTIGTAATAGTGILLGRAVAASAAVPGAFAPITLDEVAFPCGQSPPVLVDGGAYDNTGLQALDREELRDVFLVCMNAGGLLRPGAYGTVPIVRDLARAHSLLYRQSTAIRTESMVQRFKLARDVPPGRPVPPAARRGVLVALATDFPEPPPARLQDWRRAHPERRTHNGQDLALVPTVFDRLDEPLCRTLIYRGWWLVGAALATYAPERMPADPSELEPPS